MFTSYYDLESHPFQRAPEVRFYFDNRARHRRLIIQVMGEKE